MPSSTDCALLSHFWLSALLILSCAQDDAADKQNTDVHLLSILACLKTLWKQSTLPEAAACGQDIASAFSRGISSGDSSSKADNV